MLWAASEVEPLALAALSHSPYEAERMPYELLPLNNDQTSDLWAESIVVLIAEVVCITAIDNKNNCFQ